MLDQITFLTTWLTFLKILVPIDGSRFSFVFKSNLIYARQRVGYTASKWVVDENLPMTKYHYFCNTYVGLYMDIRFSYVSYSCFILTSQLKIIVVRISIYVDLFKILYQIHFAMEGFILVGVPSGVTIKALNRDIDNVLTSY